MAQSVLSVRMDEKTKREFAGFCEEAGNMSEEVKAAYPGIEWSGIHTMRNILAHDYGSADRVIIWASIEYDFPELEQFCIAYCEERGCPIN